MTIAQPEVSLHHLTAMTWSVAQLAEAAAVNGCSHVCLFGLVPAAHRHRYPMAGPVDRKVLDDAGIRAGAIEVFALDESPDWQEIEAAIDLAAMLGAAILNVHVHVAEQALALRHLAQLSELAVVRGLRVGIEANPFSQVADIATALAMAREAGCEAIADVLHVQRGGGLPPGIAANSGAVRYAQISDGPLGIADGLRWKEAMGGRLVPGSGALPLVQMLSALPSVDLVSVEVPDRTVSPQQLAGHVAAAISGTRAVLRTVQAGRNSNLGAVS